MDANGLMGAAGYECRFRTDGWVECCVIGNGEAWVGRGLAEQEALANALAQMLPSRLAWVLLQARLSAPDDGAETAGEPEAAGEAEAEAEAAGEPEAAGEAEAKAEVEPDPEPEPEPEKGDADADTDNVAPAGRVPMPARTASPESGGLFDALTDEVDEATGLDFAFLAPDLMRLQLLAWASFARDLQDRFPGDDTEHRTRGVIARLSRCGKLHWPGAVAPLRHAISPTEAGRLHGFAEAPRDWFHLAEMAEERLATLREGRDEYGWADAAALPPPPADPRNRLGEVRSALDRHLGAGSMSDGEFREAAQRLTRGAVQTLTAAARQLRWLRGCGEPTAWGEVMGRMRRIAGARSDQGLNEALDPAFSPPKSWFLQMRSAAARGHLRIVGPAVAATDAEFIEWLRTTADGLDRAEVRIALGGHLERLRGVDLPIVLKGAKFSGLRRRLRRVMDRSQDTQAAPGEPSVESLEATGALPDEAEAEPSTAADEIQLQSIVEQARGRVGGQHALFLGNRADPGLERRLTESLGLTLDWCVGSQMRTVQSAAERVRRRAYDFVLLATGFMGHSAEAIIRDAARGSDVPVVRAGKGRVLASAQAILRDLASIIR